MYDLVPGNLATWWASQRDITKEKEMEIALRKLRTQDPGPGFIRKKQVCLVKKERLGIKRGRIRSVA